MRLFADLFLTDYGLVAVAATVVGIVLPVGFHWFIRRKVREAEESESK
jgi:hypothetical protein